MVWGGIWYDGTIKIVFLEERQAAKDYIWTLSEALLPSAHLRFGTDFVFQQDNASIHTANETLEFFEEQNINKMEWPAKSPDLNPIENVWELLVRRVYDGGRQFSTIEELKRAILHHWKALDKITFENWSIQCQNDVCKCQTRMERQLSTSSSCT